MKEFPKRQEDWNLRSLVDGQSAASKETLISDGVHLAMSIREHRAAYKTPHGIGMVTAYKTDMIGGGSIRKIEAALVTHDGRIIVESHLSHGYTADHLSWKESKAYELRPNEEKLVVLEDSTRKEPNHDPLKMHDWADASQFQSTIALAIGEGESMYDAVDSIAESRDILNTLVFDYDHRFKSPLIEDLVSAAFGEEK